MEASSDQSITFWHEFQLSVEGFERFKFNRRKKLPAFALIHNSSHIRIIPAFYPNGYTNTKGVKINDCCVGFQLLDSSIHQKKTGFIEIEPFIVKEHAAAEELGTVTLGVQSGNFFLRTLAKDLEEMKSLGDVFSDNTVRIKIRVAVPEALFDLDCCFPKFEKMCGELLDDVVSGQSHSNPDFVIKSGLDGKIIECHRSVLSLASEYFRGVFEQENQPNVKRVKIDQAEAVNESLANLSQSSFPSTYCLKIEKDSTSLKFSGEVLEKVRHWMYKGESSFDFGTVPADEVLDAANYLLLPGLRSFCEKQLISDVNDVNAWEMLKLSDKFNLEVLDNRAMAVLAGAPGVLKRANAEKEEKLRDKIFTFLQQAVRAHKITDFPD